MHRPYTPRSIDLLDRISIAYLVLPLFIFVVGWMQPWASIPLLALIACSLWPLLAPTADNPSFGLTRLQLGVALAVGCVWAVLGGTAHLVFANADWSIRDAVFHDLVAGSWPVGYGTYEGNETVLRAPLGYYLPAAILGKWTTLQAGHVALAAWTCLGAVLFLAQVLSLLPSRLAVACAASLALVLFGGMDLLGALLGGGANFLGAWAITSHLEWWAQAYQYSSMTTQLFWVPNHALGGWLLIGLLLRNERNRGLDALLPMLVVALAIWSPLTALGALPFVILKIAGGDGRLWKNFRSMLHPRVLGPAAVVGLAVASYLLFDSGAVPKGLALDASGGANATDGILRHLQFFLLEAGLLGFAILAIRHSLPVGVALAVLLILPVVYLGPGNDFVMRASIPSLAVLAIATCRVMFGEMDSRDGRLWFKKAVLCCLLAVGAVTAVQEMARSLILPRWPIDTHSTLIGASCGNHPAHYVASLRADYALPLLRTPHALDSGSPDRFVCENPAFIQMRRSGLLPPLADRNPRAMHDPSF